MIGIIKEDFVHGKGLKGGLGMKVYFYSDFGYIICAETTMENTPMRVVIDPVTVLENNATFAMLGNAVFNSLEQSRNARPISREEIGKYCFWRVSGIKGWVSFSKKFSCITISEKRNILYLLRLVREADGSYKEPANQPPMEISADIAAEQLGKIVFSLFPGNNEQQTDTAMSFETVHNCTVTYRRPSDAYLDCGDGHTDAYQVFSLEAAPQNQIVFLIDSGYLELSGNAVKRKWQKQYGNLLEFDFQSANEPSLLCKAVGKTAFTKIISCVYRDGDGTMEVIALIDLRQPQETQEVVNADFERMVHSLLIS